MRGVNQLASSRLLQRLFNSLSNHAFTDSDDSRIHRRDVAAFSAVASAAESTGGALNRSPHRRAPRARRRSHEMHHRRS